MKLSHQLLACAYPFLQVAKKLPTRIQPYTPHRLRILLYHDIAPHDLTRFATQLRWISNRWKFVSPEKFGDLMKGNAPLEGDNLLLTFDDGFISNRLVAEQVLNPMGIQALFFVVSEFVQFEMIEDAQKFITDRIMPDTFKKGIPKHLYNMGWSDLSALLDQGHSIGAHTKTHAQLSLLTHQYLEEEIVDSANCLEKNLGTKIDHFAYPFGDLSSFSMSALFIANQRFKFVHSGLRGINRPNQPSVLKRDPTTPNDQTNLVNSFLEGYADWYYAKRCRTLDQWSYKVSSNNIR